MANQYPTTLNNYTGNETEAAAGHAQAHNALEVKVGTGASTPAAGLVLRGTGAGVSAWGALVLTTDVTGTLPVANGGTGVTSSTGTGSTVLSSGPALSSPVLTTPRVVASANPNPTTAGVMAYNSSTNVLQVGDGSNTRNLIDSDQGQSMSNKTLITPVVKTEVANGNSGATFTVNWASGDRQNIVISANTTLSFSNASAGQTLTLWLVENGSGGFSITLPSIKWYPSAPAFVTSANAVNSITVRYDGTNYYGQWAAGYA